MKKRKVGKSDDFLVWSTWSNQRETGEQKRKEKEKNGNESGNMRSPAWPLPQKTDHVIGRSRVVSHSGPMRSIFVPDKKSIRVVFFSSSFRFCRQKRKKPKHTCDEWSQGEHVESDSPSEARNPNQSQSQIIFVLVDFDPPEERRKSITNHHWRLPQPETRVKTTP